MATPFEQKCAILGDVWVTCRDQESRAKLNIKFGPDFDFDEFEFDDWVSYNDIGLPIAYAVAEQIVTPNDKAISYIEEAWEGLADVLRTDPDKTYANKEKLFLKAGSF
jgi:hypothetical protein